jgi:hypothetical protein
MTATSSATTPAPVLSTSVSPSPSRSTSVGVEGDDENDDDLTLTSASQPRPHDHHQPSLSPVRAHRSPKRAFDESEGSSSSSTSVRRTKARLNLTAQSQLSSTPTVDNPADEEVSTPGLSAPSTSSSASSSSLSDAPSPEPEPEPEPESQPEPEAVHERPMTRRERKAAGLPKSRAELMRKLQQQQQQKQGSGSGLGKIVIPGGRYKGPKTTAVNPGDGPEKDSSTEEWRTNGTGRLDVRGFRELRIWGREVFFWSCPTAIPDALYDLRPSFLFHTGSCVLAYTSSIALRFILSAHVSWFTRHDWYTHGHLLPHWPILLHLAIRRFPKHRVHKHIGSPCIRRTCVSLCPMITLIPVHERLVTLCWHVWQGLSKGPSF